MNFFELTKHDGTKYLYDFDSGWEIYDKGDKPAAWTNHREGRNLDAIEPYAVLRAQFLPAPRCTCPRNGVSSACARHGDPQSRRAQPQEPEHGSHG